MLHKQVHVFTMGGPYMQTSSDYGNYLANEPSPLHTTTIVEKCTQKLVDDWNNMRCNVGVACIWHINRICAALAYTHLHKPLALMHAHAFPPMKHIQCDLEVGHGTRVSHAHVWPDIILSFLCLQADENLGKFMDYCTYGHMIDNVVLIVTGTLHERDVQVGSHLAMACYQTDMGP